jgi:polysaccharide deacetylase family protein (PEP-CTERM system associated)
MTMNRGYVRAYGVSVAIGLLMAHACIVWLRPMQPGIGILSFALLCLLLSIALARRSAFPLGVRSGSSSIEIVAQSQRPKMLNDRISNAFSIDLEDYFHTEVASGAISRSDWDTMPSRVVPGMSRMLDLLEEHDTRSTVFVLGWVARRYPSLIRQIAERGHEIACHSDLHRAVFRLDPKTFYEDTRRARESIEDAAGVRVRGYRAPSFSLIAGTEWAFDILHELGFEYDSSINPVRHRFYGNHHAFRHPHRVGRSQLLEIPVASWRVAGTNLPVGGGAYLRLLPYSYTRWGLTSINRKEHSPFTIYVHPWEIDPYQPRMKLNWRSHIRQHCGVSTMEEKIARLLESFRFVPISEAYAHSVASCSTHGHDPSQLASTAARLNVSANLANWM